VPVFLVPVPHLAEPFLSPSPTVLDRKKPSCNEDEKWLSMASGLRNFEHFASALHQCFPTTEKPLLPTEKETPSGFVI